MIRCVHPFCMKLQEQAVLCQLVIEQTQAEKLYGKGLLGKIMENKNSDKIREVYKKILKSNRNNETPYEATRRFLRTFYDIVTGREHPTEDNKQK